MKITQFFIFKHLLRQCLCVFLLDLSGESENYIISTVCERVKDSKILFSLNHRRNRIDLHSIDRCLAIRLPS